MTHAACTYITTLWNLRGWCTCQRLSQMNNQRKIFALVWVCRGLVMGIRQVIHFRPQLMIVMAFFFSSLYLHN